MKRAVIDIGTNTTHLLIADVDGGNLGKIHFKQRFYIFLGEDGLERISDVALIRLWKALDQFQEAIRSTAVVRTQVIATEGLRAAENGMEIYDKIRNRYSWNIAILSGMEESELIYEGVRQSLDMTEGSYIIMDIGGGSVEFIWVKNGIKLFQESYPIGISRLYSKFHLADPMDKLQLDLMYQHISTTLENLWKVLGDEAKSSSLVGCAGTFEIFLEENEARDDSITSSIISYSKFQGLFEEVLHADLTRRQLVEGLPVERAQYIVVALGLIKTIIEQLGQEQFVVNKFAIKEGVIVSKNYFLD